VTCDAVETAALVECKVTIRDITGRADVATGLVMKHFTNKRTLFLAAFPGPEELAPVAAARDRDRLRTDGEGL
jgi:hypothetical protein